MDFINKGYGQLADLFSTMSAGARITAGLLLAVIVVSLAYLVNFRSTGPDDYLFGARPFSSTELAAVEAAFAKADLNNYDIQGNRVKIPRGQRALYVGALADNNALPPGFYGSLDKIADQSDIFTTSDQREQNLKIARQKELSLYIRSMQGVDNATVLYDTIESSGFPRTTEVTASVQIWPTLGAELDQSRVDTIRNMIAGSIGGLKAEQVTVTDMVTGIGFTSSEADGDGGSKSAYAVVKKKYENDWGEKIRKALQYVPGVGVSVNVVLEPELHHQENSLKLETKVTPINTVDKTVTQTTTTKGPAGRPGVAAQANQAQSISNGGKNTQSQTEESFSEVTGKPSEAHIVTTKAPLVPDRVTVSVVVPSSYYEKIWQKQNESDLDAAQAATPEALAKKATALIKIEEGVVTNIQETVVGLLPPLPAGDDRYPQVRVSTFQHLPTPAAPSPGVASTAMTWLGQNWSTLGMTLVGLFSLLMLRSMVKSTPPNSPASSSSSSMTSNEMSEQLRVVGGEEDEPELDEDGVALRRKATGRNLRDELTDMVREDPDAAANVLGNWIGKVG